MKANLIELIEFISQPWPWWVAGLMIGFTLFLLLWFGKEFGMSGNLQVMCAADGGGKYAKFFDFDWQTQWWNLLVALGAVFGGYFAASSFSPDSVAHISPETIATLQGLGINFEQGKVPLVFEEIYNWESLFTLRGFIFIVGGGFMVGFGARYAGGCTSGHAISGISNMQWPSLVAVAGFFIGGLIMINFILPYILKL